MVWKEMQNHVDHVVDKDLNAGKAGGSVSGPDLVASEMLRRIQNENFTEFLT